jgi:small-conductance mechanosensitive channel
MEEYDFDKRLAELERRIRDAEKKLNEISQKEGHLHNLTLRLAATEMAISEVLQKHKMIVPAEFEKRVKTFVKSLDKEISEKKISNYLDRVWKEFEGKED